MRGSCAERDLVAGKTFWLLWGAPLAAVGLGLLVSGDGARAALWAPAFAVMGFACLANAVRCGRLHCILTAPLFLAAAGASALAGSGAPWLPWSAIGGTVLVGTIVAYLPEWTWRRYARR